jgi:hypothetical protein
VIAGASLVAALVAWRQARRTARRLEQISQMYWELKYQHGELRVDLQRRGLLPEDGTQPAAGVQPRALPPEGGSHPPSFIPLNSLKR